MKSAGYSCVSQGSKEISEGGRLGRIMEVPFACGWCGVAPGECTEVGRPGGGGGLYPTIRCVAVAQRRGSEWSFLRPSRPHCKARNRAQSKIRFYGYLGLVKANADAMCMVRDASRLQTPLRCTNGSESVCPWLIHEISSCVLFAFVFVFEQSKADVYNLQVSRVVYTPYPFNSWTLEWEMKCPHHPSI